MSENKEDYRRGRHVVYKLSVHIILVTKYRKGSITDRVREHLIAVAKETCERFESVLMEADGESDHLHLLVDYPPKVQLSKLIGAIKTNTSREVRQVGYPEVQTALWGDHFWSPSYMALSSGGATVETIKKYIEEQRAPSRSPGRPRK